MFANNKIKIFGIVQFSESGYQGDRGVKNVQEGVPKIFIICPVAV